MAKKKRQETLVQTKFGNKDSGTTSIFLVELANQIECFADIISLVTAGVSTRDETVGWLMSSPDTSECLTDFSHSGSHTRCVDGEVKKIMRV
jgi:hypothetical protein